MAEGGAVPCRWQRGGKGPHLEVEMEVQVESLHGSGEFGDGAAGQELCCSQRLQPFTGKGWAGVELQGLWWPQGTRGEEDEDEALAQIGKWRKDGNW